ncbi:MAG: AMP phosphorylase [Candidatus Hodarchaeota archaeon]
MMKFNVKKLGLTSPGLATVILDDEDSFLIGAKPGDRVTIYPPGKENEPLEKGIIASVDLATGSGIVQKGEVGLYDEVMAKLDLKSSEKEVFIQLSSKPRSFDFIKKKIKGNSLNAAEIREIIEDVTAGKLLPIEMAAFIIALEIHGCNDEEVVNLTNAMAQSGEVLDFGPDVYDKHSTGGVPGNKVSLVIVPIIAAAGLFIPKTSTRAITSPSGTADSMEVLAKVAFSKDEVMNILKKEKVGIFWGGALDSAPADNALINIEKQINMDPFPLMIASIICKKMAMGVRKLVLDIPCGKGTKFPTVDDGREFAHRFKKIAKLVGIDVVCLLTSAQQPVGHAVGPALEAQEALRLLREPKKGSSSLMNKSAELAGILLEMSGKAKEGKGKDMAIEILESRKAYKTMKRIITTQGGDPDLDPEKIVVGPHVAEMRIDKSGYITSVENKHVNRIAKIAGCPAMKTAGIVIEAKLGANVKEGDVIFRIYSNSEKRLERAVEYYNANPPQKLGSMTLEKI